MLEQILNYITDEHTGRFSVSYGGSITITLSSDNTQIVSMDESGETEVIFHDDDFELLIGSK
jgi:hypothetical protein